MKTNKLTISAIALTMALAVSAQTSFDAAKLYEEELNGTARYVAMGGAMGALGSDISVISHNPAGIGTYRKSDINFSMSVFGTQVTTDPLATKTNPLSINGITYYSHNTKSDVNLGFDNFSAVFSGSDAGNTYMNFGISYRKLQNMDRHQDYYDSFLDADGYEVWRNYEDNQRNKIHSFDFNMSCNLSDKLYLGWTLGILAADTWSEGSFYDYYDKGKHPQFPEGLDFTCADRMNQSEGSGWNMSFGTIIRPIPALRLGAAIKTPTYYRQRLEYADYLYAVQGTQIRVLDGNIVKYSIDDVRNGVSIDGEPNKYTDYVEYKFTSPWSLDLSAGLTFGSGIINCAIGAEYEKHFTQRSSLTIGNTRLDSQGAIDYQDFQVLKVGTELNIGNLSIRGGYNYRESIFSPTYNWDECPYLFDTDFNGWGYDDNGDLVMGRTDFQVDRLGKTRYITCGLGYCSAPDRDGTQFYIDLAYVHGIRGSLFNVHEYDEDIPVDVNFNYNTNKVLFTLGWNF